jgi:phage terminase large subunit GpA-like protein
MQVFYNTRLALSYTNTLDQSTTQDLMDRPRIQPRLVPDWALVVTISVDTQPNRLEAQAEAWGPGLEHAVIDHQVFIGSPSEPAESPTSPWAQLDAYRATPWAHASGVIIMASVYGVDTGGHNTQDVYNYASSRVHVGCLAIHGSTRPNRPIIGSTPTKADIDHNGKRVEGGVMLWQVGTDVAKDHLHNRYKLTSGWGAMHYSAALGREWFEQLLAERPTLKRKPGGGYRRVWDKISQGDRNEALDLSVYNLALAHHLGLHKWTLHDWQRLRDRLIPKQITPDLFITVDPPAPLPLPMPLLPGAQVTPGATVAPAAPNTTAPPPAAPATTPAHPAPAPASAFAADQGGRRVLSKGLA